MYIRHISDGWCKNPSSSAMDQSELRTFRQILTQEKVSIPELTNLKSPIRHTVPTFSKYLTSEHISYPTSKGKLQGYKAGMR
jgi:hypothetical protein